MTLNATAMKVGRPTMLFRDIVTGQLSNSKKLKT